jgi:hypothetical protein
MISLIRDYANLTTRGVECSHISTGDGSDLDDIYGSPLRFPYGDEIEFCTNPGRHFAARKVEIQHSRLVQLSYHSKGN